MKSRNLRHRGFTIVELVVVIIVLGVLAVTALPRFADKATFTQAGFADQFRAVLQHARKTAIASRRYVCVTTTSGSVSLQMDPRLPDGLASPACSTNVNIPGTNGNSVTAPSGVVVSPATTLRFDPLGRASTGTGFSVAGQSIAVDQETGYVR